MPAFVYISQLPALHAVRGGGLLTWKLHPYQYARWTAEKLNTRVLADFANLANGFSEVLRMGIHAILQLFSNLLILVCVI